GPHLAGPERPPPLRRSFPFTLSQVAQEAERGESATPGFALRSEYLLMATEKDLRDRTLQLLSSNAARKIEFTLDGIYFTGAYFTVGARAISARATTGRGGIGFRTGKVPDHADASYDANDNVFVVSSYDYGKTAGDRDSLVHESFHAWRDAVGAKVPTPKGTVSTTALTDEAMAYVVGALFTNYDTTPAGQTPKTPSWATTNAIYGEAHRIAAELIGLRNP